MKSPTIDAAPVKGRMLSPPTPTEEKRGQNCRAEKAFDSSPVAPVESPGEEAGSNISATLQQKLAALEAEVEQRKRSEERLRHFLETASQALHQVGPDGTILWANEAELSMLGYAREEYIGRHIADFHADQHIIEDILARLTRGEQLRDHRSRLKCKDGSLRTVLIDSSVLSEDGKFIHTQCFTRDITEQECAAIVLRETQTRLEAELADSKLLQSVSAELISEQHIDALYQKLVNAAVGIMHSDFASMQMFYPERGGCGELRLLASHGFSEEAQRCWEWVSHETASSCGEVLRSGGRVIAKDVKQCEFLMRLGGLEAYLAAGIHSMQSTPLISRSGKLVGMISTHWRKPHEPGERDLRLFDIIVRQAADLVDRVRALETLEQTVAERTSQLRDTVAELESFSYSIAHDMRAPLRSMNGYARFLEQDFGELLPDEGKDFLRRISSGAGRLDKLITDVLNYSKLSRGEMRLEKVDIERLTREIVDTYPNLSQSNATILIQAPMPPVVGNAAALTQCISNLVSNAVKFVVPGRKSKVDIRAERREDIVRICVEDNGFGIDEQGRKRIFHMFQRLNPAAEYEGTGIGLTIVHKAVERMGGQVGVDSEPGVGSVFWIELKMA